MKEAGMSFSFFLVVSPAFYGSRWSSSTFKVYTHGYVCQCIFFLSSDKLTLIRLSSIWRYSTRYINCFFTTLTPTPQHIVMDCLYVFALYTPYSFSTLLGNWLDFGLAPLVVSSQLTAGFAPNHINGSAIKLGFANKHSISLRIF